MLYDNWRGINLLPIGNKVFCSIFFDRIGVALNAVLEEEQSGFRRAIDHIIHLSKKARQKKF